jgi:hypothetical protein
MSLAYIACPGNGNAGLGHRQEANMALKLKEKEAQDRP